MSLKDKNSLKEKFFVVGDLGSCRTNEEHQHWLVEAEERQPSRSPHPAAKLPLHRYDITLSCTLLVRSTTDVMLQGRGRFFSHKSFSSCRRRRVGVQGERQALSRDLRSEGLRRVPRPWSPAGPPGPIGRRHRRFRPAESRQRVPPVLHLQDGLALGPHGGGRLQRPRPGRGAAACGRRLHHAQHRQRQPQRSHHHDGGEGGWRHQGSTSAGWPRGSCLPAANAGHPEVKGGVRCFFRCVFERKVELKSVRQNWDQFLFCKANSTYYQTNSD